jgi:hypothetical protein
MEKSCILYYSEPVPAARIARAQIKSTPHWWLVQCAALVSWSRWVLTPFASCDGNGVVRGTSHARHRNPGWAPRTPSALLRQSWSLTNPPFRGGWAGAILAVVLHSRWFAIGSSRDLLSEVSTLDTDQQPPIGWQVWIYFNLLLTCWREGLTYDYTFYTRVSAAARYKTQDRQGYDELPRIVLFYKV